jgi:hypothetical protein
MPALPARQIANLSSRASLRVFGVMYPGAIVPEPTQAAPERLVLWCRVLRVVFAKSQSGDPVEVMDKAYRLADRVAERMSKEPVARTPADDLAGAVRGLDAIIAWCEALVPPTPLKPWKDAA